jgi:hypothetical protein
MTELQSALLDLAERGSATGAGATAQRAIDEAMVRAGRDRRWRPAVILTAVAAAVAVALASSAL